MKQTTFGWIAGVNLLLCAASNSHADTVKVIGASSSISAAELTPNEMASVFFDANPQPHTPSNPTTSTLIVPVEVGPSSNANGQNDHAAEAPIQSAANSPPGNVPIDPPMPASGHDSNATQTAAALGLIPQREESSASVPSFSNPLPPAFVLFGTALVGLSVLTRRRVKRLLA
jgi:hypothetical protein